MLRREAGFARFFFSLVVLYVIVDEGLSHIILSHTFQQFYWAVGDGRLINLIKFNKKNMKNNRVIHFEIQADDVDRAKKFYENVFDWKIDKAMSASDTGGMDYWMIVTGQEGTPGINGGMYKRPPEKKITTYDCTVMVSDIDEAIAAVRQNGGTITQDKGEIQGVGLFAGGLDTEGNKFGIMQPTAWKPK